MSIGLLLAFLAYFNVFLRRTSALIDVVVALRMLGLHAERLADIALSAPERVEPPRSSTTRQRGGMSVELRNVSFRYNENDPWVLRHLTFKVNSGEWVAIAGPSGCGKSTLVKLLAGLWKPTEGEILVNGVPLDDFGLEEFRQQTGVVLQDDQLFSGSVAQNISFFAEQQNQTRIETCAGLAAVHDDIMALPMRYSTLVGDMGTVLSGGQKQRILLARAIYKAPGLMLLDEATSHLDVPNEHKVNRALSRMKTTRIVVAHRPETLRAALRVIELNNGRLVPQDSDENDNREKQLTT
jgi:ATP-binding cassette subfamily B protein RaxB